MKYKKKINWRYIKKLFKCNLTKKHNNLNVDEFFIKEKIKKVL